MSLDSLIFDNDGNPLEREFLFEKFIFKTCINYVSILTKEKNNISIPSSLCGFSTANLLANIYEGKSSILGFHIEVKKLDNGATFFLIDNSGFRHSNKDPSFVGGILQEEEEYPSEYMLRHHLPATNDYWTFLSINGIKKLVNLETEDTLDLIDKPKHIGIRSDCLDLFHQWIIDEFGKKELCWFEKWGEKLVLINKS